MMYLGLAPLGGDKDLLLLDYIDIYIFTVLSTTYMMAMEATTAMEAMRIIDSRLNDILVKLYIGKLTEVFSLFRRAI
jgi:hypothetical protein